MTSTQQRRSRPGGGDPASRGLILVGVAVVLGLIILIKGGGVGYEHSTKSVDVPDNGAATTTTAAPTTTVATVAPADVPVVVANGSGQTGLAKTVANSLKTAGFTNTTPTDAVGTPPSTTVYFAPSYETSAQAIGSQLQLDSSRVQALPTGAKLAKIQPDNVGVIVVLGQDASAATSGGSGTSGSSGSSTTSTTSTTTTTTP